MKRTSNYDRFPATPVPGHIWRGWDDILECLRRQRPDTNPHIIVVECYQGIFYQELSQAFRSLADLWIDTEELFHSEDRIEALTRPFITYDRIFGHRILLKYQDYFDEGKVLAARQRIAAGSGIIVVFGHGASFVQPQWGTLVYADMARWEIQQRFRKNLIHGIGIHNESEPPASHYKRGYFVDWVLCDYVKRQLMPEVDFWLDTNIPGDPKMIEAATLEHGLDLVVSGPFRVVPFFDPAPWGGQWMKEVCNLDREVSNYGWCFDCVPEENSLALTIGSIRFEMPANNLVFARSHQLLGGPVEARFGQDFPIRFDFLDTIGGGNLSLQVHPTTQYIRDTFGLHYTQDESYYILDATPGATVYLGVREGIDPEEMLEALRTAQQTGGNFEATRFVNQWPAKKHDHFLIPAGTIHCSGAGTMVLEISATPNIFTFKLWDWNRLGLDGLPRPINIEHGSHVIQWDRNSTYVRQHLVNAVQPLETRDTWRSERTGLHENEFIETRRYFFRETLELDTCGGVQVLNLVEGEEALIESPSQAFPPYVVHYAETFIIPASVGAYTIKVVTPSAQGECGIIQAYVRVNP